MEEFSIPAVKQEPITSDIDNVKYPELLLNDPVPLEYLDEGIYINPVEIPSSIPYKTQPDFSPPQPSLEKFPPASSYKWENSVFGEPSYPGNKEKHEEAMLMDSLLDIDGLLDHGLGLEETNTALLPNAQNYIMEPQPPVFMAPPLQQLGGDPLSNFLPTSVEEDLLIPVTNSSPPAASNHIDQLVAEIMGGGEWILSNGSYQPPPESNSIPSVQSSSPASIDSSINEDEMYLRSLLTEYNDPVGMDEDPVIPPPSKRSRASESSIMSIDPHDSSPDLSPAYMLQSNNSPSSEHHSSPPPHPSTSRKQDKPHSKSPPLLFGQHEDSILSKLMIPQLGKATKPIARDKLVSMPVEEFNALLDQTSLTEIEVAFMKEWRRRGKNKTAAQIARKRKRDELSELQMEIDELKFQKAELQRRAESMSTLVTSLKRKARAAENQIYKSTAARGLVVSVDTHSIHVTDDCKTMLVPRIPAAGQPILLTS